MDNIFSILSKNSEKYLKTSNFKFSGLTDEEKDRLEVEVLTSLQTVEKSLNDIQGLLDAKGNKLECQNKSDYAHKKIAISCLYKRMRNIYSLFKQMKDKRTAQMRLRTELMQGKKDLKAAQRSAVNREFMDSTLQEEEKRELKREGMLLMDKYNHDVQDVKDTQAEMIRLSELMNKFSNQVYQQDMMTSQILEDAVQSFDHIHEGNKQLNQAAEYAKSTGVLWAAYFITLGIVILLLDYLN